MMTGKKSNAAERKEAARERAFMSPNSLEHFCRQALKERDRMLKPR
jgi:hypothetical protein